MTTSNRDFSLDLLRALACIMVFGVHFVQHFPLPGAIGAFFEKGSTGVGFFFILSGYLAYCSLEKEFSKTEKLSDVVRSFYIKRAVHVLPLYYIMILFYFIFFMVLKRVPADSSKLYWVRYIFFLNRWVPTGDDFWVNLGATWSISVFVLFYILVPFIFCLVKKSIVAGICVVLSYAALKGAGSSPVPIMYMFFFFLGILVYIAEKEGRTALVISIECLLILFLALTGSGNALMAPVIASLFILATRNNKLVVGEKNVIYRIVNCISVTSYSIYLVHALVITVMDALEIKLGAGYLVIFLIATIGLTALSYCFVEKRLAKSLLKRLVK